MGQTKFFDRKVLLNAPHHESCNKKLKIGNYTDKILKLIQEQNEFLSQE